MHELAFIRSLFLCLPRAFGSIYVHVAHAPLKFLIQELTHACVIATVEAEVRTSSVSIV